MEGSLSFFEIGAGDGDRAMKFYAALFGWELEAAADSGGYSVGGAGVPGGIHGGDPGASPYVFFAVDDIERAGRRIRELGGEVDESDLGDDPDSVAKFGRFRLCRDDQGSQFGIHQAPAG